MIVDHISEVIKNPSALKIIKNYWTDLTDKSLTIENPESFWNLEYSKKMMTYAYDLIGMLAQAQSLDVVGRREFPLTDDFNCRSLAIKSHKMVINFIFDITKLDLLNNMKNADDLFPKTNVFIVLLPFSPEEDECRIASDLREKNVSVLLMGPVDFNALIAGEWTIDDLVIYKIFRTILLGRQDIESLYDEYSWADFIKTLQKLNERTIVTPLMEALDNLDIKITELIKHPSNDNIRKSLLSKRNVLISGPSSSGKTYLALNVAYNVELGSSNEVWYVDIGSANLEWAIGLGVKLLERGIEAGELILILDDLQTNPDMGKQIIMFFSLLQKLVFKEKFTLLGISWPELLPELKEIGMGFESFEIKTSQLSNKMIEHYGEKLNENQI